MLRRRRTGRLERLCDILSSIPEETGFSATTILLNSQICRKADYTAEQLASVVFEREGDFALKSLHRHQACEILPRASLPKKKLKACQIAI
jgi:hypothetical protein